MILASWKILIASLWDLIPIDHIISIFNLKRGHIMSLRNQWHYLAPTILWNLNLHVYTYIVLYLQEKENFCYTLYDFILRVTITMQILHSGTQKEPSNYTNLMMVKAEATTAYIAGYKCDTSIKNQD